MTLTTVNPALLDTQAQYTGFKNRIINGQMVIDQRNAGAAVTSSGEYKLDRWLNYYSGPVFSVQRSTTAPAGFNYSYLATITTASASAAYSFIRQIIEGFNSADLSFGTANASTVTLSFWVRSSVTGIYSCALLNAAGDRAYAAQYTINSANTWEQKSITIAGDTSGTWVGATNGAGLYVTWNLGSGAARTTAAGSWAAGNYDGANGSTGATTWANTSGATFYITGVQLEKGSTATSFDYRPYGTELALCQRYYYEFRPKGVSIPCLPWANTNNNACFATFSHPVAMRTAPTITYTSQTYNSASTSAPSASLTSLTAVNITAGNIDTLKFGVNNNESGNTLWAIYLLGYASAEL